MKIFKQLVLLMIVFFGLGIVFKYVHADSAPEIPLCADGSMSVPDGTGGYKLNTVTCGYLSLNVYIDVSQYKDTLVLLNKEEDFVGDVKYSVVANGIANVSTGYKKTNTFLAVDKEYFDSQGGLTGIFSITTHTDSEFGDYNTMDPKNSTEFTAHSYVFLLPDNDPLAKNLYPITPSKNGYILFSDEVDPYQETTHLECGYPNICTKDITYVIKSISSNDIFLNQGKIIYTPSNIGESITYPIYNQQPSTTSNQNQIQTEPAQNPPEHLSFWQHFWNWVKSIF